MGSTGQAAWGNQNVQISEIAGSSVNVLINGSTRSVSLEPAVVPLGQNVSSPARLLRARAGVVPFTAHEAVADRLQNWCLEDDSPFSAMLVGGVGGSGKTRLAVQICTQVSQKRWLTGLLPNSNLDGGAIDALIDAPTHRLVVVDYAETRIESLAALLPRLALSARPEQRVRVMMLSRVLSGISFPWWENPTGHDRLDSILEDAAVEWLDDKAFEPTDRQRLFDATTSALGARIENPTKTIAPVLLDSPVYSTPLMVSIAAYLALSSGHIPTDYDNLFAGLLDYEDRYWARTQPHAPDDPILRRRIMALATLTTPATETEAVEWLTAVPNLGADSALERRHNLATWAHNTYPGPNWWNPVEPDLLGEHLVSISYTNHPAVLEAVLATTNLTTLARVIDVFGRVATNHPDFASSLQPLVTRHLPALVHAATIAADNEVNLDGILPPSTLAANLDRLIKAVPPDPQALADIVAELPPTNVALAQLALTITTQLVEDQRQLADQDPADVARHLLSWSIRLAAMGHLDEGLAASEEALNIRRRLADTNPAAYLSDLADSLRSWSIRLAEMGRHDEGLAASEEALRIRRRLADTSPAAHLPGLATTLHNWSNRLGDMGHHEQALAAAAEALQIERRIADASPATPHPRIGTSLSSWSDRLARTGRHQEALAAGEEAIQVQRRLAETNPATHLPTFATSLNNWSVLLGRAGRRDEAVSASEEAVQIRRRLAEINPAAYLPSLAASLNNWSNCLGATGRHHEALAPIDEALQIHRHLADANPRAHLSDLASSLNNWSSQLTRVGRHVEALTASEESVSIQRRLADSNPAAHLPGLALALSNWSNQLAKVGRQYEALAASERAVQIRRRLADASPAPHLPGLASSLNNWSIRLSEMGRDDEALTAIEEAVQVFRHLADDRPAAYLPDLALSLNNWSNRLSSINRDDEATTAIEEAVQVFRHLAEDHPAANLPGLASSLLNSSNRLSRVGRDDEALTASKEAVEIFRRLADDNAAFHLPDLATALETWSCRLEDAGREGEALAAFEEAAEIRESTR